MGHDCFVAAIGNAFATGPNLSSFATFDGFQNYICANNNITWRNFTSTSSGLASSHRAGSFLPTS